MSVVEQFVAGGPFMWPILACGIVTAAVIVERVSRLYFEINIPPRSFRKRFLELLQSGNIKAAESHAGKFSRSGLGKVAALGCYLRSNGGGEEELQARMDEALNIEVEKIDRNTGFLAMLGNVATLLGLLGTISGLVSSFSAVSHASPAERALMLSRGISEALFATGFGLVIAIPALVAYACFQNKTEKMINQLTHSTGQIYHDLLFFTESSKRK